jgi:hypothetical protein
MARCIARRPQGREGVCDGLPILRRQDWDGGEELGEGSGGIRRCGTDSGMEAEEQEREAVGLAGPLRAWGWW